MQKAIDAGLIVIEFHQDFDGKGPSFIITLNNERTSMMLKNCPFCGIQVQNLLTDKTQCRVEKVTYSEEEDLEHEINTRGVEMELEPQDNNQEEDVNGAGDEDF